MATNTLTWYGQAGFIIETPKLKVAVDLFLRPDPHLREPVITPQGLGPVALALATHEHHDHLDAYTLLGLQESNHDLEVIVPEPVVGYARGLGLNRVRGARHDDAMRYDDMEIIPLLSRHAVHIEEGYHFGDPVGRFLGYVFRVGREVIYHSGDTVMYSELADHLRRLHVTIALLPINGRSFARESVDIVGNLLPEEAVELAHEAGVEMLIPMHYETYPNNLGDIGQTAEWAHRRGVTLLVPRYQWPLVLR